MPPRQQKSSRSKVEVVHYDSVQTNQNLDVTTLVEILPLQLHDRLLDHAERDDLAEIVMDIGRKPEVNFGDHREQIRTTTVTARDLEHVISRVGEFGDDNRAGIDGTLHRVSCIRNRRGTVIGLTLKVGKPVKGSAEILNDVLEDRKSVLFLGAPGIGKSTVVRDVARLMSNKMQKRVVIVDTFNEIGGYGNIPHPILGGARRMQVPDIDRQHNVMMEAAQNHRPEVVIVDEVGRLEEVSACRSICNKGVQIIATVHGNTLDSLLKNNELVGLIGSVQSVTEGGVTTIKRVEGSDSKKTKNRELSSAFDVLVEMRSREEWYIHDVETTLDQIIKGQEVHVQARSHSVGGGFIKRNVTYIASVVSGVPKAAPRKVQVAIDEHSNCFKAAVIAHLLKRIDEDSVLTEYNVDMDDLRKRIMKTTKNKMVSILSRPSQLDEAPDFGPSNVLLTGGLELWLRRVADAHRLELSRSQYECASQTLAGHALHFLELRITDLRYYVQETEEEEEEEEEEGYWKDSKQESLEQELRELLRALIEEQRASAYYYMGEFMGYDYDTAEEELWEKMSVQVEKIWECPEDIGTVHNMFNVRTEAQENLYAFFRKMVAYAGKGVKGVSGEEVKAHAVHLTGVANSMIGELEQW